MRFTLRRTVVEGALCLGICLTCYGHLLVYDDAGMATKFDDVPAMRNFGPRIPSTGFTGRLQLVSGFGCSPNDFRLIKTAEGDAEQGEGLGQTSEAVDENNLPIAALISRSLPDDPHHCTFETKVVNAQKIGIELVVVYDYVEEAMFHMQEQEPRGMPHGTSHIPSVLVSQSSGLDLQKIIKACSNPQGPKIFVDPDDPVQGIVISLDFTMIMVITGFLLVMVTCGSLVIGTLHSYVQRYDTIRGDNRPLSVAEAMRLSEVVVEVGSRFEDDSCPVCLEPFQPGEKLRGLSCSHAFHQGCIIPWLTQRQRTCPMCKQRVEPGQASSRPTTRRVHAPPTIGAQTGLPVGINDPTSRRNAVGREAPVTNERHPLLFNLQGPSRGGGTMAPDLPPV